MNHDCANFADFLNSALGRESNIVGRLQEYDQLKELVRQLETLENHEEIVDDLNNRMDKRMEEAVDKEVEGENEYVMRIL